MTIQMHRCLIMAWRRLSVQQRYASVVGPKSQRQAFFSVSVEIDRTWQDEPAKCIVNLNDKKSQ